jgi:hypothetical protein
MNLENLKRGDIIKCDETGEYFIVKRIENDKIYADPIPEHYPLKFGYKKEDFSLLEGEELAQFKAVAL